MPTARSGITWGAVLRLATAVTVVSALVVLVGGTASWLLERGRPASTMDSWGDAVWWSLTTMTTVGYGDHVPVTTGGRLVAAGVMVAGVAIIGAVAAVVALAVARRIAREGERELEAEAEGVGRRLEARLTRIEARLAELDALLRASSPTWERDDVPAGRAPEDRGGLDSLRPAGPQDPARPLRSAPWSDPDHSAGRRGGEP